MTAAALAGSIPLIYTADLGFLLGLAANFEMESAGLKKIRSRNPLVPRFTAKVRANT